MTNLQRGCEIISQVKQIRALYGKAQSIFRVREQEGVFRVESLQQNETR